MRMPTSRTSHNKIHYSPSLFLLLTTNMCNKLNTFGLQHFSLRYSAPVRVWSIVINLSVCLCVFLSVRKHISGTAGPIRTKFCVQIPCGRGSVIFWWRCTTLCTSGLMNDVTFGRNGREAGKGW